MPLGLRVNTAILAPLRNLSQSVDEGAAARARLSSGLRIQKASDDPAGLAVAGSVEIDKRVSAQGLRNVNDGISYLNIAESAANELGNIVDRLKELSTQASNGTMASSQRAAMHKEATSLSLEYNRIIRYASFNDRDVLATSNSSLSIGAGYTGASIDLNLAEGRATLDPNAELGGSGLGAGDYTATTSVSFDARFVTFYSASTTLVAGDVNGLVDTFIQDRETGLVELVSQSTAGVQGNGASISSAVSDDGNYVAFYSTASTLVAGDVNGQYDIFLRDRNAGTTSLVSVSSAGVQANNQSDSESISADGRYVVFRSDATNLVADDTNGVSDIFLRDTVAGTTTLISRDSSGTIGNGASLEGEISADGKYIVYHSDATNLVSGDTNSKVDIFKYEIATGTTTRVSLTGDGNEKLSYINIHPSVSADGRYVSFTSGASYDGDYTFGINTIWRKDTETGEILRVSRGINASSSDPSNNAASDHSSISADGQFVAYYSDATNIVSGDTNGVRDVFVTDVVGRVNSRASESDSGVQGNASSASYELPLISGDGVHVVFDTNATNLYTSVALRPTIVAINPVFKTNVVNLMTGISLRTQDNALYSLERLESYSDEIINLKGVIGASSSRLTHAASNLTSAVATYEDAYSKITDADVASDATKIVQANLLTQSALATIKSGSGFSKLALDLIQSSMGSLN